MYFKISDNRLQVCNQTLFPRKVQVRIDFQKLYPNLHSYPNLQCSLTVSLIGNLRLTALEKHWNLMGPLLLQRPVQIIDIIATHVNYKILIPHTSSKLV